MVKLRLMRMGKKKQPFYRVVAADSRSPRNGRFIEIVGTYDSRQHPSIVKIDNDKAVGWLKQGAQPTERVEKILKISGAWDEFKGNPEGTSVPAAPGPEAVVGFTEPSPPKPRVEKPVEESPELESTDSDEEPSADAGASDAAASDDADAAPESSEDSPKETEES